jgi:predicted helicase
VEFEPPSRRGNFSPAFITYIKDRVGLNYVDDGHGDLQRSIGPEDIFDYMYSVLHSPSYRSRYEEFLRGDYPRIPFTSDLSLFRTICGIGKELVALHLMEADAPGITRFPVAGDNVVRAIQYSANGGGGKVWINEKQFFEGVPEKVWLCLVGGYRPCEKWLGSRKGRELSHDELTQYQRIVAVLGRTLELMDELEKMIPAWPLV